MNKVDCRAILFSLLLVAGLASETMPAARGQEIMRIVSTPDTSRIMKLIRQGNALIYKHTDSALQLFTKAEELSRLSGFPDGVGFALANMGLATTTLGDFEKGFAYYDAALPFCRQAMVLKSALIYLYFNMALSWGDQENYPKANDYYHKALRLIEERYPDERRFLIALYNNLISIQVYMGSTTQAFIYADRAIDLAKEYKEIPTLAQVLLNKGDIYFSLKDYDQALGSYNKAAEYVKEVQENSLTKSYYRRMGDVLLEKGRYQEALSYLEKAKKLKSFNRPLNVIMADYSIGDALYRLGRNREAEKILLAALAKAKATGLTKNQQNGHAVLMALYKDEGRYKEAFEQQGAYLQLAESIVDLDKIRAVNEIEIKYQVAEKNRAIVEKELKISQQSKKLYRKNITIASTAGGIMLLVIAGLVFYRYKQHVHLNQRKVTQLKAMMAGEEKERVRLARELHDGIGGMLTGIKLSLRGLQRRPDSVDIRDDLSEVMGMLKSMEEEIRLTAHNLMPDMLVKHGLKEALQLYCEHLNAEGQVNIELQIYGELNNLDRNFELQLYRIIQELLQNIFRHADARYAAIQIRSSIRNLCVSVEDDGVGFDTERENTGLGLRNMESRVKAMDGTFSIASTAEIGTTVYMEFTPDVNLQAYGN